MLELKYIIKSLSAGVTSPHLVEDSNGIKYVVKFPGNPDGERALINEYICSEIAILLELPILPTRIMKVDFFNISGIENLDDRISRTNGIGFASLYNTKANIVNSPTLIKLSNNYVDIHKIMIFDLLIYNMDRNKGNLLIDMKYRKICIIDHTHVFKYGTLWRSFELDFIIDEEIDINILHKYNWENYLSFRNYNLPHRSDELRDFINKVKRIDYNVIYNIVNRCSLIWNITKNDIMALSNFLSRRFKKIDKIIEVLRISEMGELL